MGGGWRKILTYTKIVYYFVSLLKKLYYNDFSLFANETTNCANENFVNVRYRFSIFSSGNNEKEGGGLLYFKCKQ